MKHNIEKLFTREVKVSNAEKIILTLENGQLIAYDYEDYEMICLPPEDENDYFTVYSDFHIGILALTSKGELIKFYYHSQTHQNPDNPVVEFEIVEDCD